MEVTMKRKSRMRRSQLKRKAERGLRTSAQWADKNVVKPAVNTLVDEVNGFARAAFDWMYR